ncbi:MAG: class B sortase, partial [Clostridiales bacterium]|nr:class B sortase [Clostridiales bacterium]
MKNKKTKKNNNILFTALTVIFALIFVFSLFKLTSLLLQYKREKAVNQQLVELLRPDDDIAPPAGGESQTAEGEPQMLERYKALYETNGEMIGWIEIPGTQANGPVVQSPPENREKYLRLDFFGKSSNSGTFFLDSNCDLENSDNLIIHGHRMNNGTMFGELNKYRDEAFWRKHPTFSFDTLYKKQTWEVVAACNMKLPMINIDKSPEEQEYNYTV